MIVDAASEVIKIPEADVEPSPASLQDGGLNCVTGLGKSRGRLIVLLDMARLLENGGTRKTESEAGKSEARGAAASK